MKKYFLINIAFFLMITGCNTKQETIDITGNWTAYSSDSVYSELFINDSIIETFEKEWELLPNYKYYFENNSLLVGNATYKVKINNKNSIELIGRDKTYSLTRINQNEFTLEKLLKEGILLNENRKELNSKVLAKYVDSNFTIRNIKTLISMKIKNKEELLNYWESELKKDTLKNEYLRYLIEKIEKN